MIKRFTRLLPMFLLSSLSSFAQNIDGDFESCSYPWNGGKEGIGYANYGKCTNTYGVNNSRTGEVQAYASYAGEYAGTYLYHNFPFKAGVTYHIQVSIREAFSSEYSFRGCGSADSRFKIRATNRINGTTVQPGQLVAADQELIYERYVSGEYTNAPISQLYGYHPYAIPFETLNLVFTPQQDRSQLLFSLYNINVPSGDNMVQCAWDLTSYVHIDNLNILEVKEKWGTYGTIADGTFNKPVSVATDASGNVYTTDGDNRRVQKFSSSGAFLGKWGAYGTGDGQFMNPSAIVVDKDGFVYVGDGSSGGSRIQKFTSAGGFLHKWGGYGSNPGQFKRIYGLATDQNGNIYATDNENHRVQKFNSSGTLLLTFGSYGSGDGQLNGPTGIAVDKSGNIYVSDRNNNRIQKFNSSGVFVNKWGATGSAPGQFNQPFQLSMDQYDNLFVADAGNHRIQKFDKNGNLLHYYGTQGSNSGQFNYPSGIAISNLNNLYVVNHVGNSIQAFSVAGKCATCPTSRVDDFGINNLTDIPNSKLQVYPNPSASDFYIKLEGRNEFEYEIFNSLGERIIKAFVSGNTTLINDEKLTEGAYVIKVNANGKMYNSKIVIIK